MMILTLKCCGIYSIASSKFCVYWAQHGSLVAKFLTLPTLGSHMSADSNSSRPTSHPAPCFWPAKGMKTAQSLAPCTYKGDLKESPGFTSARHQPLQLWKPGRASSGQIVSQVQAWDVGERAGSSLPGSCDHCCSLSQFSAVCTALCTGLSASWVAPRSPWLQPEK